MTTTEERYKARREQTHKRAEAARHPVGPDENVTVKRRGTGGGSGRRYHRPADDDPTVPACEARRRWPDEKFRSTTRKEVEAVYNPCQYPGCFGTPHEPVKNKTPCPLCGEPVEGELPPHIRKCAQEAD